MRYVGYNNFLWEIGIDDVGRKKISGFRLGRKVEIDIVGRKELEEYIERDIEYIEERNKKEEH